MIWYYEVDHNQKGPVPEDELAQLYERGVINKESLVWREGMSEWSRLEDALPGLSSEGVDAKVECPTCGSSVARTHLIPAGGSQVCPNCKDEYAQGLREGLKQPVSRPGSRGTGGQTPNDGLRMMARDALAGNWGVAVVVTLLFLLLQEIGGFIPLVGVIVSWLIIGPLSLGQAAVFLGIQRNEATDVGTLFSGFSRFLQGLGLYFITTIIVSAAAMAAAIPGGILIFLAYSSRDSGMPEDDPLFIVGLFLAAIPAALVGVYMYLRYALIYYIANDHPELGVMGAIKTSTRMMHGRKSKLFLLGLSFIGWHLLGLMALGVGLLWSLSYMYAGFAAFYDDIGDES